MISSMSMFEIYFNVEVKQIFIDSRPKSPALSSNSYVYLFVNQKFSSVEFSSVPIENWKSNVSFELTVWLVPLGPSKVQCVTLL